MKTCRICSSIKPLIEYNTRSTGNYRTECKTCQAEFHVKYREQNKEALKQKIKEKYHANKEVNRKKALDYYNSNREARKAKANAYYHSNKEKVMASQLTKQKEKLKVNPIFKMQRNLRNRMWYALKDRAWKKHSKLKQTLGLSSYAELKTFLESTFTPEMNWDNYGTYWDIDHIVPLSSANTPEKLTLLGHYTNLRAMEKVANRVTKRDSFNFKQEYTVKLIEYNQGQDFLLEHHYLKRRAPSEYTFGLFLSNNCLVGVCTFTTPFSPGLKRMVCGPEQALNVIELNRLAVKDYLPTNTESWFVAQCLNSNLIQKDIVVTFADTQQGHTGTIYKALNFIYTGLTKPTKEYASPTHSFSAAKDPDRASFGYRDRSIKHRFVYFIRNKKRYSKLLKF